MASRQPDRDLLNSWTRQDGQRLQFLEIEATPRSTLPAIRSLTSSIRGAASSTAPGSIAPPCCEGPHLSESEGRGTDCLEPCSFPAQSPLFQIGRTKWQRQTP